MLCIIGQTYVVEVVLEDFIMIVLNSNCLTVYCFPLELHYWINFVQELVVILGCCSHLKLNLTHLNCFVIHFFKVLMHFYYLSYLNVIRVNY